VAVDATREWQLLRCCCRVFAWSKAPEGEEFWRKLVYVLKARIDLDTSKNFIGKPHWNLHGDEKFDDRYLRALRKMEVILFTDRHLLTSLEELLLEYIQLRLESLNLV
jgi:hypothetical protein